jgi:DNA ligase 1
MCQYHFLSLFVTLFLHININNQCYIYAYISIYVKTFGRTTRAVKEAYDEEGDLGIVAEMSRSSQRQLAFAAKPKPLTITQVLSTLREIATVEGNKSQDRKISTIQKMLRDCKGAEARFLVRALQGKLRIGLAETTVLVALAHAVVQYNPPVIVKAPEGTPKQDVPLECEEVLKKYYESGNKSSRPPQEILDAAVVLVKQAFAECSDHGRLARALLSAPLHMVREFCYLIPGTPVSPMLAKPTKVR